jgi:L-lactate dehydrogenase complex protein LldE
MLKHMTQPAQIFITCIVDTLYPQVGEAVVRVLQRAGAQVDFPAGQTCCGQPALNAGMRPEARRMAEQTIRILEHAAGPVVLPSGSCTGMIRHGYPELFAGDPEWQPRAKSLAERTYEFTEFLVDVLGVKDLAARYPGTLTYHPSCHLLRDLGVTQQPHALLSAIEGAVLVELPHGDECCGFGGLFSVEYAEISDAMLERKIANIESTGADLVVSCDAGCISNINGGLHRRRKQSPKAVHIAQILDQIP